MKKIISKLNIRHRLPLVGVLCLLAVYVSAQTYLSESLRRQPFNNSMILAPQDSLKKKSSKDEVKPKLIKVEHANAIVKRSGQEYQVLKDSVIFFHDGAYLYCDSAYYNKLNNTFEAFSNVRMEQGDTLFLYGDHMHYDGDIQLVRVRDNVKMDHLSGTLFTDSLNYDRKKNIGYYFEGGMLVDSLNELTSYWGQYEPNKRLATFTDSVKLVNPNFTLFSDTLEYSTESRIATILSPSRILSDSGTIISSRGWYNTISEEALLLDQSTVLNKEEDRLLRGDSILYFKFKNQGEVFGNMFLQDTLKKVILQGHYGFYDGNTDYAYAKDSASAIEYSQGDSLFLHADILELSKLEPKKQLDSISQVIVDSIKGKKAEHEIKAYYGVRFYRSDIQGVCDSMHFKSSDSILHMYKDPILWNLDRQLTGDTIDMFMNDSTIDRMHIKRFAYSIEKKDSLHFNQLKSKSLQFFFQGGKLYRVYAEGNVETIAYPEEKDGSLNQILNWLEGSYLEILLKDGVFDRLKVWPSPVGKTTPFHLIQPEQLQLSDFYWYDYMRPLNKDDIFRKVKRNASDVRPERPAIFDREE